MVQFRRLDLLSGISENQLDKVIVFLKKIIKDKTIILLNGPMGAGKTTLVRKLLECYGIDGVQSPTFALHNRFSLVDRDIEHLDLFRMKSEAELEGLGFWDFFDCEKGIVIIEWASKMNLNLLPVDWHLIQISIEVENSNRNFLFEESQELSRL